MKTIAIYCRVSTQEQNKQETIETQLSKLKEKYKNPIKIYKDVSSGAYLQRQGLSQLREDVKKGLFDKICVYALDRLSRKLGHQIALIEEFEKYGAKVEVLGESYEDTAEGILNRNMRGAFSEYERYKIAQRMRDGKYRKAKDEFIWGTASYGYQIVKNDGKRHLVINPKEAKVVRLMFKIYSEEYGLGKTANRIYKMGYKARTKRNGTHIALSSFMISKILDNETYLGNFYYGKTYPCEPEKPIKKNRKYILSSRGHRPREEWGLLKVPSIIDKATFERVQEVKKRMAKHSLKPTRHYLCQGLIKCVSCGYRYIGKMRSKSHRKESPNGSHFYYVCPKRASKRKPDEPICISREINTKRLDEQVWEYVSSLIKDKEKIKKAIKNSKENRESKKEFNQKVYDSLIIQKAEIKKEKSRILSLYGKKSFKEEDLEEKIAELNSQQEDLERQIKEAEKDIAKIDEIGAIEKEIEQSCLEYRGKLENAGFEFKRKVLKRWVKEINLPKEGNISIIVRIPPPEKPIAFQPPQGVVRTYTSVSEEA